MKKYLIISDIHGAAESLEKCLKIFRDEKLDKIICLGDLLYHGPRNDLPKSYNPKKVVSLLTTLVEEKKIIWVQGNCDAEVDEMVMNMKFKKRYTIHLPDHKVIFSHGHHLSRFDPDINLNNGDVVVYGHYHVLNLTDNNGVTYLNIGSTSIPKDEHAQFAIFRDEVISVYDLNTMEPLLKLDLSV